MTSVCVKDLRSISAGDAPISTKEWKPLGSLFCATIATWTNVPVFKLGSLSFDKEGTLPVLAKFELVGATLWDLTKTDNIVGSCFNAMFAPTWKLEE